MGFLPTLLGGGEEVDTAGPHLGDPPRRARRFHPPGCRSKRRGDVGEPDRYGLPLCGYTCNAGEAKLVRVGYRRDQKNTRGSGKKVLEFFFMAWL